MTAHVARYFGGREPSAGWPSFAISTAFTATLFALALDAMRSVRAWSNSAMDEQTASPTLIRLSTPPMPPPALAPTARRSATQPRISNIGRAPTAYDTPGLPATALPPIAAPVTMRAAVDSLGLAVNPPVTSHAPGLSSLDPGRLPVPGAPAGVTIHGGGIVAPYVRDSLARAFMAAIGAMPLTPGPPLGPDRRAYENGRRQANLLRRRTTSAGSADLAIPQGNGVDGVGAVGNGLGQLPLPFLSSGPSRAKRRLNDSIDAINRAVVARLQARVRAKRDSAHADSLRRSGRPDNLDTDTDGGTDDNGSLLAARQPVSSRARTNLSWRQPLATPQEAARAAVTK